LRLFGVGIAAKTPFSGQRQLEAKSVMRTKETAARAETINLLADHQQKAPATGSGSSFVTKK
jgi:hypothetical protein